MYVSYTIVSAGSYCYS